LKNKTIKISQIGVGYWGPNLLRNLMDNKQCVVISVVDLSENRREYVKMLYPEIDVSGKLDDIINSEEIKAVIISTPVATHYELAIKCLKSGKHILVEKPIATSTSQVKDIGKLAKKNNLVAMVGHTFLFNSAVRYIKSFIDSGELGEIRYIYSRRLNLGRIRDDVDALWNLAPHDISIIQYWLNDPEPLSIKRFGQAYIQEGIDDVVFLNILYPNNVIANIHVSWLDPHKTRKITIVGSKKMISYDDMAEEKVIIYDKGIDKVAVLGDKMDFDNQKFFDYTHRTGDKKIPIINWEEPLKTEIEHFIDCINNKKDCLTGPVHAEKVVKILSEAS
jgi:predicted dehydrogenase